MSKWPTVPLAQLAAPSGKAAGEHTALPVYSVTKHRGFVPSLEYFKKQVFSRELSTYTIVEPGEFAYATIHLDEGSIGICPERCLISPMYTAFRVVNQDVDPSFLLRYLRGPRALAEYPRLGKGTVERRRAISFERLGQIPIPLPPIAEQRRIAKILDKADALRAKRREAMALLDTVAPAIFLDMFGDPATNPKGMKKEPLGRLLKLKSGDFLPATDMVSDGDFSVYGGNGISGMHNAYMFEERRIVIGRVGAYCGCVHVSQPKSWITDNALYVSEQSGDLVFDYLVHALTHARLNRYASQFGQPLVSGSRIYPVEVLVPDRSLQVAFVERVRSADKLRVSQQSHAAGLQALFESLQHRAFHLTGALASAQVEVARIGI